MDEMSDEQKEYEALELAKLLGMYHYYLLFSRFLVQPVTFHRSHIAPKAVVLQLVLELVT